MGRGQGGAGGGAGGGGRAGRAREAQAGGPKSKEVLEVRDSGYGDKVEVTKEIADAEAEALNNPAAQAAEAYRDLPEVENANRQVIDKMVHVGPKGAPKVTPKMSNQEAMDHLSSLGLPKGTVYDNILYSNDAPALAELLPPGSKFLGAGVEGAGFALPDGKNVLRIQHGGGRPLLQADVGKVGMYADWTAKYGNTWVEKKPAAAMQGKFIGKGVKVNKVKNIGDVSTSEMLKESLDVAINTYDSDVVALDDHGGNWGIDYKGRVRVFDAGAYRPKGNIKVTSIWEGEDVPTVKKPGAGPWQRVIKP